MCNTVIKLGERGVEITSMGVDRFWQVEVISDDLIIVNGRRCLARTDSGCVDCYLQDAPVDICAHMACHATERTDSNNTAYQLEDGG